jgi:hypothetical protein
MLSQAIARKLNGSGYDGGHSLSQLLAEIEKRGWSADSVTLKDGGYGCDIYWLSATVQTIYKTFEGESREDAAVGALLHILRQ